MSSSLLEDLEYISKELGTNTAYVQGGGGNTSVKLDNDQMAIKASGCLLSELTTKKGYSIVDYKAITKYLERAASTDNLFAKQINSFVVKTKNRPSIETPFHALLPHKYVIHTHSVYVNLLSCSKEGKKIAKDLFNDAIWVQYKAPGRELILEIKKVLSSEIKQTNTIVILQNHGIIVASNNAKESIDVHNNLNKTIKEHFNIPNEAFTKYTMAKSYIFTKESVLFPDQVVYNNNALTKSTAQKETEKAYEFILDSIKDKGLTPNFISSKEVNIILNMESEQYRQKVIKSDIRKS